MKVDIINPEEDLGPLNAMKVKALNLDWARKNRNPTWGLETIDPNQVFKP